MPALSKARAVMVCVPAARPAPLTENVGPPFGATMLPSTDQLTLMTAGSMTLTFSIAGFVTAPAGGSTESYGCWTARQMSMTIFSRETELKAVFAVQVAWLLLPQNRLFIIELLLGRQVPPPLHAKNPCIPVPGLWL